MKESMSRTRKFEHPYIEDGPETPTWERRSLVFHWAAIGVGALSLLAFIIGMLAVRNSIKKLRERPAASLLTYETNVVKHEGGRVIFTRFTEGDGTSMPSAMNQRAKMTLHALYIRGGCNRLVSSWPGRGRVRSVDGRDACEGQEKTEVIREVSIRAGDGLAAG